MPVGRSLSTTSYVSIVPPLVTSVEPPDSVIVNPAAFMDGVVGVAAEGGPGDSDHSEIVGYARRGPVGFATQPHSTVSSAFWSFGVAAEGLAYS